MTTYYVATTGSDANPGTEDLPFLTIQEAVDNMVAGDTTIVEDGVYTGAASGRIVETFNKIGSSGSPFTLRARNKWAAILDGQHDAENAIRINSSTQFWTIDGFRIRNITHPAGDCGAIDVFGSSIADITFRNLWIHTVGKMCTDSSNGNNGIFVGASSGATPRTLIDRCMFNDIGRFGNGESGCVPSTTNWQNHDHAIYVAEANDVTILNCLFWDNIRGWCIQRFNTGGHNTQNLKIIGNSFAFENPNRDGHIILATSTTGCVIENNLFYDPRGAGVAITGGTHTSGVIRNNETFGGPITTGSTTGFTLSNNLDNSDPLIVSAAATPDLHLTESSPARGAGVANALLTVDFDGVARSNPPDIGAFQFVEGAEAGSGSAIAVATQFTALTETV